MLYVCVYVVYMSMLFVCVYVGCMCLCRVFCLNVTMPPTFLLVILEENFTEWNRSCCRLNKQWVQFAEFWLGDDVHIRRTVVSFDQLLTNRTVVLRKVLEFLKLPVDENKLKCVSGMIAHHAKRRYPESGKFYPYSSDQLSLLRQSILSLQSLLVRHGVDSSSWLQLEDSLLENSSDGAGTPRT